MNSQSAKPYPLYFAVFLAVLLLLRLISLWFNNSELFFDEAQYWFWSTELAGGYFSKPPLLAWIIAATTAVCGSQSEFCVRLAAPLLHTGTAILIYLSACRLFDVRTGFWAGVLYALLPAVSLSSTIISTDVPLLFCWALALYAYIRFGERFELGWALVLGIAIGLGLNAKYAMMYFVGCGIIHALFAQQEHTPARRAGFWLAVFIALVMLIPNVLWNLENSFATVSHTGDNIGWKGFDLNWSGLGEFFGSQFGVFGPILFGMFLATVLQMFRNSISPQHRLLLSFSLPILLLICVQAVMSKAYANWAAATYIAATILVAEILVNRVPWGWMRSTLAIHGVVFIVLSVAVGFAGPGQLVLPNGKQPFDRTQGAKMIAEVVENELDQFDYNALITTDRKLSSLMHYNLRNREEAILSWRWGKVPRDHFELTRPYQDSPRDPALVLSRTSLIPEIEAEFKNVEALGRFPIEAGEIHDVYLFRLTGHESFE